MTGEAPPGRQRPAERLPVAAWGAVPSWEAAGPGPGRIVDDDAELAAVVGEPPGRPTIGRRRSPAHGGRVRPLPALVERPLSVGSSLAIIGAGLLAIAAASTVGSLGGDPPQTRKAVVTAEAPAPGKPGTRTLDAATETWKPTAAQARRAAADRARAEARERRRQRLERARQEQQRPPAASQAPATTQAVSATQPSAPPPPADPWAGVSPMVRQTTPGPWNNGGMTS